MITLVSISESHPTIYFVRIFSLERALIGIAIALLTI